MEWGGPSDTAEPLTARCAGPRQGWVEWGGSRADYAEPPITYQGQGRSSPLPSATRAWAPPRGGASVGSDPWGSKHSRVSLQRGSRTDCRPRFAKPRRQSGSRSLTEAARGECTTRAQTCRATSVSRAPHRSSHQLCSPTHPPPNKLQDTSTSPRGSKGGLGRITPSTHHLPGTGAVIPPSLSNPRLGAAERRCQRGLGPVGIQALPRVASTRVPNRLSPEVCKTSKAIGLEVPHRSSTRGVHNARADLPRH